MMKKEYRAMYDKIAPLKSDEELLNSVLSSRKGNITMKNEKQSKKHITKAIAIPIAAALALGATAVGAVAVYSHNTAEEYARVLQQPGDAFKQEYKTSDGEEVNLNTEAVNKGLYDELNIELNKTFEYEDFTIEFPGAVCDGRDILLMYNITFKKDLECLKYEQQCFGLWGPNSRSIEALLDGTRAENGIMTEVDGKKVYKGFVDYSGIENCGESVNLHFSNINSAYANPSKGIDWYQPEVDIDLEIPLTGDFSKFNKTVEADTAQHVDLLGWGEWDVESVDISSLLITFNVKTDGDLPAPDGDIFKEGMMVFPINVTMKDGSTLDLGSKAIYRYGDDPETKTGWFMAVLNYPLDVDNVQSVQFASAVIDIDGNASTIEIPEIYEMYDENGRLVER